MNECVEKGKEPKQRYKSEKELYQAIVDFRHESNLSSSEKAVYNALCKVDEILRWRMYQALFSFIDKWLRVF